MSNQRTTAVRAAIESDKQHGAVVPPIYLSSNFAFAGFDWKRPYDYTRSGNPTRDQLSEAITELEGGHSGVVTSSGMSAVIVVTHLLDAGDLILAAHDCYGGCHRAFDALSQRGGLSVDYLDFTSPNAVENIRLRKPKLVWLETPSNPLLRVTDIEQVSQVCKQIGALLVVDNTFLSPALQQPLSLGADIVVHSTTKYLNGHSDVVGGAVVAKDPDIAERIQWWANCLGITGAPFDSFLTLRGIRTLHARLGIHEQNTHSVVDLLCQHPAVSEVYYPGLENHPQHELAKQQQKGFGGMVSFELTGGLQHIRQFVETIQLFSLAESLGGVESLVAHPATMTHASMTEQARETAGISSQLLRLSVGLEATEDLLEDLKTALDQVLQLDQAELNSDPVHRNERDLVQAYEAAV